MSTKDFKIISDREYWVTSNGDIMYPHQFEDDHLVNTVLMLKRRARQLRLEEARVLCNQFHRIGHNNIDINHFYSHFKKEMNEFIDPNLSDEQWMRDNSKIFNMLIEEALYRQLSLEPKKETKKFSAYKFNYNFNLGV